MEVEKIVVGNLKTNCYVIKDEENKEAIVIDPADDIEKIRAKLDGYSVNKILITHGHFDHIKRAVEFRDIYNTKIGIHKNGKEVLENPELNLSSRFMEYAVEAFADEYYEDGDIIDFNGTKIRVIYIGGHAVDCVCYYFEDEKVIFSGDTIFYKSMGRTDLYGGDYNQLKDNVKNKIFILDEDIVIYPGHGRKTDINSEIKEELWK